MSQTRPQQLLSSEHRPAYFRLSIYRIALHRFRDISKLLWVQHACFPLEQLMLNNDSKLFSLNSIFAKIVPFSSGLITIQFRSIEIFKFQISFGLKNILNELYYLNFDATCHKDFLFYLNRTDHELFLNVKKKFLLYYAHLTQMLSSVCIIFSWISSHFSARICDRSLH